MAKVNITQRLNRPALAALLVSPSGPVARDLLARGFAVQSLAKINLGGATRSGPKRIDTGRLRASIAVQLRVREGKPIVRVGTNVQYALFVHEGTGIYGPRHRPIRPRTKRYLRFKPRGSRTFVFARQVKGARGNKFLLFALQAARVSPAGASRRRLG